MKNFESSSRNFCELALAVEDETVIRKERSGITLKFSSRSTYPWRARTDRVRSRIQSRRSAGAFFADFHRASASPSLVTPPLQSVGRNPGRFSRAIAIALRLASRIDDETRRYPVTADNSRFWYRSYFSAVFAIAKQFEPVSTSVRHFGANPGSNDARRVPLVCRAALV